MKLTSSSFVLRKSFTILVVATFAMLLVGMEFIPKVEAFAPVVGTPITVETNTTNQELTNGMGTASCSYLSTLWIFYIDQTAKTANYVSSTDGRTWTSPVNFLTLTGWTAGGPASADATMSCSGNIFQIAWLDNTLGAGKFRIDYTACNFSGLPLSCSPPLGGAGTFAQINSKNGILNFAAGSSVSEYTQLGGHIVITGNIAAVGRFVAKDGTDVFNDTTKNAPYLIGFTGATFIMFGSDTSGVATGSYFTSADLVSWSATKTWTAVNGGTMYMFASSAGVGSRSNMVDNVNGRLLMFYTENGNGGACGAGGNCVEEISFASDGSFTQTRIAAGQASVNCYCMVATGDGTGNVVAIQYAGLSSASLIASSSDSGITWSSSAFTASAGTNTNTGTVFQPALNPTFSSTLAAFVVSSVSTANPFNVYAQVFGVPSSASNGAPQTQTIGACPTSQHGTFLANNTQYWYSGNALGNEVVNTIQVEVNQIKGSGSHTLDVLLYAVSAAAPSPQAPSGQSPAVKIYESFTNYPITAGTKNSTITIQISVPLNGVVANAEPFNFWAVAIAGDDHISIVNSALSGLTTQTGTANTAPQPAQFTSNGAASSTKLGFCATGQFQTLLLFTTTTTQPATTTATVFTTSTQTTLNLQAATQDSASFTVMLIVILLPAMVMMGGAAVATHNGAATVVSFVGGLGIGTALGYQAGLVPFNIFFGLMVVMVFMIMGIFMVIRGGGGGA